MALMTVSGALFVIVLMNAALRVVVDGYGAARLVALAIMFAAISVFLWRYVYRPGQFTQRHITWFVTVIILALVISTSISGLRTLTHL